MGTTLHTLKPNPGATKPKKRLGRGHGSGLHKTAGKGQKGQKARTGHHGIPKPGFEGGQTAMARRLPKRGFTNHRFKKDVFAVNLGAVAERFDSGMVDIAALKEKGLVPRSATLVKILGDGEFSKKLTIHAHYFSESAKEKLEKSGGKAEVVPTLPAKTESKE
ncbi:MAG: 50S ribosomal protein L15 [Polyangia bacterium]|jgi:large subunit ribosomal protein L15